MSAPAAPHDLEAERAALGAVFIGGADLLAKIVGAEHGLRASHFYRLDHGRVLDAMAGLLDRREPIDTITVRDELRRIGGAQNPAVLVDELAVSVPSVANWPAYVRTVKHKAYLRDVKQAARVLDEAADLDKPELIAEAERLLGDTGVADSPLYTPERQAEDFLANVSAPVICPWPWEKFNDITGGMRAPQVTFVSGRTNHGKSPVCDDILLGAKAHGLRTGLYINEMGEQERAQRFVAMLTDLGWDRIRDDRLSEAQRMEGANALFTQSVPIRDVSGWSMETVCRDIARSRLQVAGIDILHNFDYRDEGDLRRMMTAVKTCAQRTGCHIVVVGHLRKPDDLNPPVLGDILGAGMIANLSDFVVFVHRELNDLAMPQPEGRMWFAKTRNAGLGGGPVTYDWRHMRFVA